jgi:prepilin-type N-terminal cleavage/methylation domain-containing protein
MYRNRAMSNRSNGGVTAGIRRACARTLRGGFSLLETSVAISVLGVGLVMVAAVFPVALAQHRNSADKSRSSEMIEQAQSALHSKIDGSQLWIHPAVPQGFDSSWYALPSRNLWVNGTWDATEADAVQYANLLNGTGDPAFWNRLMLFDSDILSDRLIPVNDAAANLATNRFAWYGFYRKRGNGSFQYAIAVCKQRQNQRYVEQDVTEITPGTPRLMCSALPTRIRRLPVPWRVAAYRVPPTVDGPVNWLANDSSLTVESLAELAPVGSKILIAGGLVYPDDPSVPLPLAQPRLAAGRVLNVIDIPKPGVIAVKEDISDLPTNDLAPAPSDALFDVWVFPPAMIGVRAGDNVDFEDESPLVDWRIVL